MEGVSSDMYEPTATDVACRNMSYAVKYLWLTRKLVFQEPQPRLFEFGVSEGAAAIAGELEPGDASPPFRAELAEMLDVVAAVPLCSS